MLSSRLLNDLFMSRVSQTRDYERGEKVIMLSSPLLNDVFVSNRCEESMLPFTPRL
jgi:hypothetical protein